MNIRDKQCHQSKPTERPYSNTADRNQHATIRHKSACLYIATDSRSKSQKDVRNRRSF